jgi:hypothetical protein
MEVGLDILQNLPGRHPGLFDGPLHLSDRKIRNLLTGHAAESGLFRRRIVFPIGLVDLPAKSKRKYRPAPPAI